MKKELRIHFFCLIALGIMVGSHFSIALLRGKDPALSASADVAVPLPKEPCQASSAKAFGFVPPKEKHISCASVKELDKALRRSKFDLKAAKRNGSVPRVYVAKLPHDMHRKKHTGNSTFIQALLPHILNVNEEILKDREKLLAMQSRLNKGGHLRRSEKLWLSKLSREYRCKSTKIPTLLKHVDVVPPSLALSQALLETGGGRSHAALKKNSTFGHMSTKTKVARFDSLHANVKAYIVNLNRHAAYKEFRQLRAEMRAKDKPLCSLELTNGLLKYSVRKAAYTQDLRYMIKRHDLTSYDKATLCNVPVHP